MTSAERPGRLDGGSVLRYGERALLLEVGAEQVGRWAAAIAEMDNDAISDVLPAAATVFVRVDDPDRLEFVRREILDLDPAHTSTTTPAELTIPVTYDGPDLVEVAERVGLEPDEVVERHQASAHRVQFCGFSPGFGYIGGLDPILHLPRRSSPRPRVPAGSVSIAGAYSAVYPTSTPGGWHLIGRTELILFDPAWFEQGRPPALLQPGLAIRFEAVG